MICIRSISHVCSLETIKRYQRAGFQICDITTYPPLQECISFELCPSQPYASFQLADSLNEHGSALLDSLLICEELQTSLNKKRGLSNTSIDGLSSKKFNQSTESADGGGFLNFYKPLDYISSVLSFCSIFLDM